MRMAQPARSGVSSAGSSVMTKTGSARLRSRPSASSPKGGAAVGFQTRSEEAAVIAEGITPSVPTNSGLNTRIAGMVPVAGME
jgi:hypothetical protein